MSKDTYNNIKEVVSLPAQAISADGAIVGEIIDTYDFKSITVSLNTGAVTTGDIVITSVSESDASDMADETVIPDTRLFNTPVAITEANSTDALGVAKSKRYIRVTYTGANTAVMLANSIVILGKPIHASTR